MKEEKKIWIDLDNSPHVPFFKPIIEELNRRGYQVTITARDCFQVCGLADLLGLPYESIGRHYGKSTILKVAGSLLRAVQLAPTAIRQKISVALSHGSRSQVLTAWMLGIPSIGIFDYEHTAWVSWLPWGHPTWIIASHLIPKTSLKISQGRVVCYEGFKEDVYVPGFKPDTTILKELGIGETDLVVTIRPPATEAHYHNPESDKLFVQVVNFLGRHDGIRMVVLPRNERNQRQFVEKTWPDWCRDGKVVIPNCVVDGLNLIWFSDFVVSGGGTMNREAAALRVPVYSIFRGKIGAVDRYLSDKGRLTLIDDIADIPRKIVVTRRDKTASPEHYKSDAMNQIVDHIETIIKTHNQPLLDIGKLNDRL